MQTLLKYPDELRTFSFDFSEQPELADEWQTIESADDIVHSLTSGSGTIEIGTPSIDGCKVSFEIAGGTAGAVWTLVCYVTTNRGARLAGVGKIMIGTT